MGICNDIKSRYRGGSILLRLIYWNVGIFVALRLVALAGLLFNVQAAWLVSWVELPSSLPMLLQRPWTLLTYMVCHYDVWHILFNLLWLYWLGRIFLEYFTPKQLGGVYFLGGLSGALLFVLAYRFLPYFEGKEAFLIGASASVMALVVAVATYAPHYRIGLLFLGEVSLKWVAIISIAIVLLGTGEGNAGAQVAHVGGVVLGFVFGWNMRRGHDITAWLNTAIDAVVSLFKRFDCKKGVGRPAGGTAFGQRTASAGTPGTASVSHGSKPSEAEIDVILDKLKRSGYGALSDEEKETLFRASSKK